MQVLIVRLVQLDQTKMLPGLKMILILWIDLGHP